MSSGSSSTASDAEDPETRRRRRQRRLRPARFSDEDLQEERDGPAGRGHEPAGLQQKELRQSQRNAANARERARMRVLSRAFVRLKTSLPWVPADTKLSKLDTLRLASSYICHLRQLLQDDRLESGHARPVSLTWPFMMAGHSEDSRDVSSSVRLCGATA